jgi:glycosyltransferase involved in cell wall biosynthesis
VSGLLVPPGEAAPLARAIERLGNDLELAARMGEAGRRRALERFLQERCTDRTELVYREKLLNGRAHRNGVLSALARDNSAASER